MKFTRFLALISLAILCGCTPAKITFHVVSDEGKPLSDLPFSINIFDYTDYGEGGFGSDRYKNYVSKTDKNALVSFTYLAKRGGVGYGVTAPSTEYYAGGGSYQFKDNFLCLWMPWNPTVEVVIKPIINPIAMYATTWGNHPLANQNDPELLKLNTPIGFDLEARDYVAPYGKGTNSDFIFTLTDGGVVGGANYRDTDLTISFNNKGDGIQSFMAPLNGGSQLLLPRFAPEGGYEPTLVLNRATQLVFGMYREDQNYFFRVRTVLDENGKVKSALYGKIYGNIEQFRKRNTDEGGVVFTYYLNPTPNDRNMEFDPQKNLFKNILLDQNFMTR